MSHYDYTFKIMMLGDSTVGKAAMTKRYSNSLVENNICIKNSQYGIVIWDNVEDMF